MQRTYDGSFDIRISISFARLVLNWVAAWRRQRAGQGWTETKKRRGDEDVKENRGTLLVMTNAGLVKQKRGWGTLAPVSGPGPGLASLWQPPASAPVCEAFFSRGAENPHQTAHSGLERADTLLFVVLWESMLLAWIYECVESAEETWENKDGLKNRAERLTVSGRFLSLSSSLSKHWVRMLFSDMHMTCRRAQI